MIATLTVATSTPPSVWRDLLRDDPQMVATVLDVLAERKGGAGG